MEEIAISKFKATCLAVLEEVRKTRQPIRVTRFGKPVADIQPPAESQRDGERILGSMEGVIELMDDLIKPAIDESEWESLRR